MWGPWTAQLLCPLLWHRVRLQVQGQVLEGPVLGRKHLPEFLPITGPGLGSKGGASGDEPLVAELRHKHSHTHVHRVRLTPGSPGPLALWTTRPQTR